MSDFQVQVLGFFHVLTFAAGVALGVLLFGFGGRR
jgi:hypothetical protein